MLVVLLLEPFAITLVFIKPCQKHTLVQRRPLVEERYALLVRVPILKRESGGSGINNLMVFTTNDSRRSDTHVRTAGSDNRNNVYARVVGHE